MESCPWCHDDAELDVVKIPTDAGDGFAVTCSNCGCVGPMGESREQAIEKWQNRVGLA